MEMSPSESTYLVCANNALVVACVAICMAEARMLAAKYIVALTEVAEMCK